MILNTDSTNENRPGHSIRMYWTNLWQPTAPIQLNVFEELQYKFVVHIFTLLLANFTPKLVSFSKHSEPLKYVLKSTISCLRRDMSSISEFYWMFKDSLWREYLTNFVAKGAKRSVKMLTTYFCTSFSKNILLYMNSRPLKIRLVHTYDMTRTVYFDFSCITNF